MLLLNTETQPVSLAVSCDDRHTWIALILEAHSRERYQCDSPKNPMWMHINTDLPGKPHREVEQELKAGERYEIYFDNPNNEWNVRQAVAGTPS